MKLKFIDDAFYDGELKYKKDHVYEISDKLGEATRWLKRCAIAVNDHVINDEAIVKKEEVQQNEPEKEIADTNIVNPVTTKENKKGKSNKGK